MVARSASVTLKSTGKSRSVAPQLPSEIFVRSMVIDLRKAKEPPAGVVLSASAVTVGSDSTNFLTRIQS